ncbi:MAG TPA: DinB family protein [Longimicrobiaceae bacterium]|nr:DinB family protein [Longimicrobiaceae bacterium]
MSAPAAARALPPRLIQGPPGFAPVVGRLASMLGHVRSTTLRLVRNLSTEQLDHVHDGRSNSIGALLAHLVAMELRTQTFTFEGRGLNEEEDALWGAGLALWDRARHEMRGNPASFYTDALEEVRARTLRELAARDDAWLDEVIAFSEGVDVSNHYLWFHLAEDEASHRGQVVWLLIRLLDVPP